MKLLLSHSWPPILCFPPISSNQLLDIMCWWNFRAIILVPWNVRIVFKYSLPRRGKTELVLYEQQKKGSYELGLPQRQTVFSYLHTIHFRKYYKVLTFPVEELLFPNIKILQVLQPFLLQSLLSNFMLPSSVSGSTLYHRWQRPKKGS